MKEKLGESDLVRFLSDSLSVFLGSRGCCCWLLVATSTSAVVAGWPTQWISPPIAQALGRILVAQAPILVETKSQQ